MDRSVHTPPAPHPRRKNLSQVRAPNTSPLAPPQPGHIRLRVDLTPPSKSQQPPHQPNPTSKPLHNPTSGHRPHSTPPRTGHHRRDNRPAAPAERTPPTTKSSTRRTHAASSTPQITPPPTPNLPGAPPTSIHSDHIPAPLITTHLPTNPSERTSTPLTPHHHPSNHPPPRPQPNPPDRQHRPPPHDSTHSPPTTRPSQALLATTGPSTQAPPTIDVSGHRPPQHHNNHHRPPLTPEQTSLPSTSVRESDIDTGCPQGPRPPRAGSRLHDRHRPVPRKIVTPHHITAPRRTPNPPLTAPPAPHHPKDEPDDNESRTARLPAMKQRRVGCIDIDSQKTIETSKAENP